MKLLETVKSVFVCTPPKKEGADNTYVPTLEERKAFAKRIARDYRKTFEKLAEE